MQFAGSASTAASFIGPSARKSRGPQDDKWVGARAMGTVPGGAIARQETAPLPNQQSVINNDCTARF